MVDTDIEKVFFDQHFDDELSELISKIVDLVLAENPGADEDVVYTMVKLFLSEWLSQ